MAPNNYLQKLYDHHSSISSSSSSPIEQLSLPSTIDTLSQRNNDDKKQLSPHVMSSPGLLGSRRNADLSALSLLRKQADIRINALKNAVEKIELISSSSQPYSVAPSTLSSSVASENSNNTRTVVSHRDNEDDIEDSASRDGAHLKYKEGNNSNLLSPNVEVDQEEECERDRHYHAEQLGVENGFQEGLKVSAFAPQQISIAAWDFTAKKGGS